MPVTPHFSSSPFVGITAAFLAASPIAYAQQGNTSKPTSTLSTPSRALTDAPEPSTGDAGKPVPQSIVTPSGKALILKFNDEFEPVADTKTDGKPYIDRDKWQTTFWQGSSIRTLGGNAEAQYYMDKDYAGANNLPLEKRPNPFSFEKPGILTISATKTPKELWSNYWMGTERPFSSGLLISDKKFIFKYGYVEGRFKLPKNRGAWPAFWMLMNNPERSDDETKNHYWPPEIDIFEAFGHSPNRFTVNIIAPKSEKVKLSQFAHDMGTDLTEEFHTWGLEWDEEKVVYYFDGKEIASAAITDSFRQPMYLLINLAVGGNWYSQEMTAAKTPAKAWEVDETTMPWKMECDYVRVYQSNEAVPVKIGTTTVSMDPLARKPAAQPVAAAANVTPTAVDGPTPYPDPKAWEAAWPGTGPIRSFGWMVDNRKAFWQNRVKDQGAIVIAGDSLAGGWKGLGEAFPGLKVANRGIGGDVSRGLLFRFKEDVLDLNPRAIVLQIGTNDLSTHSDPAVVEHNLRLMIDMARAQNPKVPIVLCQVPPRDVKDAPIKTGALADLNSRIVKLGVEKSLPVLDLYTPLADADGKPKSEYIGKDGIHILPEGYKVWADLLQPAFEKLDVKAGTTLPSVAQAATTITTAGGPTPYPDAKTWEAAAWPGKGPIRTFGWMVNDRKRFWQDRAKDQGAVVFAGDSQTAGWKSLAEAFPNLKVANRGIGGDVSRGLLFRFKEDVLDLNPRAIVILIGGNDLSTHSDPAVVEHNLGLMIDMARAKNPNIPIVLNQIAPRNNPDAPTKPGAVADLNARVAKLGASKENVVVVDLFTPLADANGLPKEGVLGKDGTHMAAPAYKVWAELLQSAFDKLGVK